MIRRFKLVVKVLGATMTADEQAELNAYIAELDARTNFDQEDPLINSTALESGQVDKKQFAQFV